MKKQLEYDVVEVIWVDAEEVGDTGWNNLKGQLRESKKPCPVMKSVGYCIYRSETHISVLSSMGKENASTLEKIPMSFVVQIKNLILSE
mgnify:CR=1 FL=1